ncbi:MAG: glycoside hydrolase domain-containing protein, partial [Pseudomonadota bacterium]
MSSGFRIVLRAAAAFFAFAGLTCQASASTPIWWGNSIGRADVVLPGWSPVEVDGSTLVLGADRRYEWKASLLPARVSVGDDLLAGPFRLVATINGERVDIAGDRLVITQESPSSATVDTEGSLADDLSVVVSTRVEYDGLGSISITLTPGAPVNLDGFDLEVDIVRSEYQRMLAFDADTIHKRHKQVVFPAEYAGPFLNVLGFPDGERSFWLFADHAEGWIWNSNTVTEVAAHEDLLRIRQRLIGAAWTVSKPMHFEIHFLATPVRNASGEWRTHRAARLINEDEARIAHYQTWWMTAFAHQDLPYTDYPDGVRERLPKADIDAYPGVVANRAHLDDCRAVGITRLPYFSAHTLSGVDPVLEIYRDRWEVVPIKVMPDASDAPFTAEIGKRWLSQRGEGYTDYLLHRFAAMIGELGFDGLYFDQGGVIGSRNPASGGWTDSNGVRQAGTDILATRALFKRLAVLFHERGKPGLVVVHNSRVGVVPAYTFVTSMLQGEEYTVELAAGDYIRSTDLDELRSVFAPGQYGVGVTWMSQLFSPRTNIPARRGR